MFNLFLSVLIVSYALASAGASEVSRNKTDFEILDAVSTSLAEAEARKTRFRDHGYSTDTELWNAVETHAHDLARVSRLLRFVESDDIREELKIDLDRILMASANVVGRSFEGIDECFPLINGETLANLLSDEAFGDMGEQAIEHCRSDLKRFFTNRSNRMDCSYPKAGPAIASKEGASALRQHYLSLSSIAEGRLTELYKATPYEFVRDGLGTRRVYLSNRASQTKVRGGIFGKREPLSRQSLIKKYFPTAWH